MHQFPNILRTTVIGCEAKHELSKMFAGVNSGCEIGVFLPVISRVVNSGSAAIPLL